MELEDSAEKSRSGFYCRTLLKASMVLLTRRIINPIMRYKTEASHTGCAH